MLQVINQHLPNYRRARNSRVRCVTPNTRHDFGICKIHKKSRYLSINGIYAWVASRGDKSPHVHISQIGATKKNSRDIAPDPNSIYEAYAASKFHLIANILIGRKHQMDTINRAFLRRHRSSLSAPINRR